MDRMQSFLMLFEPEGIFNILPTFHEIGQNILQFKEHVLKEKSLVNESMANKNITNMEICIFV